MSILIDDLKNKQATHQKLNKIQHTSSFAMPKSKRNENRAIHTADASSIQAPCKINRTRHAMNSARGRIIIFTPVPREWRSGVSACVFDRASCHYRRGWWRPPKWQSERANTGRQHRALSRVLLWAAGRVIWSAAPQSVADDVETAGMEIQKSVIM